MKHITDATHADLQIANAQVMLSSSLISSAIRQPELRHELPGRIADCVDALTILVDKIKQASPDAAEAMELGRRSTHDLAAPIEASTERAAA